MRKVNIYISGHTEFHDKNRPTFYRCVLVDAETGKVTSLPQEKPLLNSTTNQAMIIGIIESLSFLRYPCDVKIYTKASFGAAKMKNPSGPNAGQLAALNAVIAERKHQVSFEVDPQSVNDQMKHWQSSLAMVARDEEMKAKSANAYYGFLNDKSASEIQNYVLRHIEVLKSVIKDPATLLEEISRLSEAGVKALKTIRNIE